MVSVFGAEGLSTTASDEAPPLRVTPKASKDDQRALALWAADCAEHVLAQFEARHPEDERPRRAIEACRTWARTGVFRMADVRRDSLAAHAAARDAGVGVGVGVGVAARFAARAAGHAVATAHVASHALGAAWYAVKAADAAGVSGERDWQYGRLPERLRPIVQAMIGAKPTLARALQYPNP